MSSQHSKPRLWPDVAPNSPSTHTEKLLTWTCGCFKPGPAGTAQDTRWAQILLQPKLETWQLCKRTQANHAWVLLVLQSYSTTEPSLYFLFKSSFLLHFVLIPCLLAASVLHLHSNWTEKCLSCAANWPKADTSLLIKLWCEVSEPIRAFPHRSSGRTDKFSKNTLQIYS